MKKLLASLTGLVGYIHIVLFPVLISLIVSLVAYINMPDLLGLAVAILLCFCGLVTGVVMALMVLKKRGPAAFIPVEEDETVTTEQEEEEKNQASGL